MARCSFCSAPLPKDSITCSYCGQRNDIDLRGEKKRINLRPNQIRTCPVCNITLDTVDVGVKLPLYIEHCSSCFGLFFDHNELETLVASKVQTHSNINYKKLRELNDNPRYIDIIAYRKCPVCSKIMNRKNYASRSGVIMDVCHDHGIWLDASELTHILEWSSLSGHNVKNIEVRTKTSPPKEPLPSPDTTTHSNDIIDLFWELFSLR